MSAYWSINQAKAVYGAQVVALGTTRVRGVQQGSYGVVKTADGQGAPEGCCRVYVDWGGTEEFLSPREFETLVEIVEASA